MFSNYKVFLFDLDHTLVYVDEEYIQTLTRQAAKRFGIDLPINETLNFWFGPYREAIIQSWGINPKEFLLVFDAIETLDKRKKSTKLYEDTMPVLRELKKRDKKMCIVTAAPLYKALAVTELIGKEHFKNIISTEKIKKPNPDVMRELLNILYGFESEALLVGNGIEDILTAKNLGIDSALILRENFPQRKSYKVKPTYVIRSLRELVK